VDSIVCGGATPLTAPKGFIDQGERKHKVRAGPCSLCSPPLMFSFLVGKSGLEAGFRPEICINSEHVILVIVRKSYLESKWKKISSGSVDSPKWTYWLCGDGQRRQWHRFPKRPRLLTGILMNEAGNGGSPLAKDEFGGVPSVPRPIT
jgi:hypothetical protein